MEYRRLGNSRLQVSVLALGTWTTIGERLDLNDSKKLLGLASYSDEIFELKDIHRQIDKF